MMSDTSADWFAAGVLVFGKTCGPDGFAAEPSVEPSADRTARLPTITPAGERVSTTRRNCGGECYEAVADAFASSQHYAALMRTRGFSTNFNLKERTRRISIWPHIVTLVAAVPEENMW